MTPRSKRGHTIERVEQVRVLESTVCQEIVDLIEAAGPCSVREMARFMSRRPDSLYYHVHKLQDVGLLIDRGKRGSGRRAESVYDIPGRPLRLAYHPSDPENVEAVRRVVASMLRSALRDFRTGFRAEVAVVEGEERNLWAARMKSWLSDAELAELNRLLGLILELFHRAGDEAGEGSSPAPNPGSPGMRRLHTLTWILAPAERGTAPRPGRT